MIRRRGGQDLEEVFDVSGFLNYLAVNSVIQNWDTYGIMSHNYYLYHDPTTDLLTWIPWDNNEVDAIDKREGKLCLSAWTKFQSGGR